METCYRIYILSFVIFHAYKWKHVTEFILLHFTHTNGNMLQHLYCYISRTQMETCYRIDIPSFVIFHAHKWKHVTEFILLHFTHTHENMLQNLYSNFRYISRTQIKACYRLSLHFTHTNGNMLQNLYCYISRTQMETCYRIDIPSFVIFHAHK